MQDPLRSQRRLQHTYGIAIMATIIILLVIVACTGCTSQRLVNARTELHTDSTTLIQQHEVTHLTVHDTLTTHEVHHLTVRDTSYTTEHIIVRYDPLTGYPTERIEDRTISHASVLDSISDRIGQLWSTLDSLHSSYFRSQTQTHRDTLTQVKVKERTRPHLYFRFIYLLIPFAIFLLYLFLEPSMRKLLKQWFQQ